MQRPTFASVQEYGRLFTDSAYWRQYVAAVCTCHGFLPCRELRGGVPGTMPVFIVDNRIVVKLFSEFFHGEAGFRVEKEVYALLAGRTDIPAPALLASGTLFPNGEGWTWPYLVTQFWPGLSASEADGKLSAADRFATACWLAPIVRRLHHLQPAPSASLNLTWAAFASFLAGQRAEVVAQQRLRHSLPERLIARIDAYLPPLDELVDFRLPPHVVHADLNDDHVLGCLEGQRWRPTGIIDFGDARAGDRLYELIALHIGLFHGDKALLRAFLDAYGFDAGLHRDFARRALSMTLLHEFNVLGEVVQTFPGAAAVGTLEELAALLWDLEQPGFDSVS